MSEWKKVKLGDILQIKKGEYITKKEAREGIYPVILGGREPAYYIDRYNHTGKAIVVSRSGASAGYISFWNEPIFVTDGFLIEPKEKMSYEFLYYALKSKQLLLHNAQKGAAIPHVTPFLISDIDFLLPNEDSQHRIATILSRYDSLIENYQKQIKLLEEAAQRLYKEWFVDLHFPGHENTKIVDGVPEGWRKGTLDEIAYESGKKINKNNRDCFDCYLPIDFLPKHSLTYLTPANIKLAESSLVSFEENDIIFGAMRPYFHKVCFAQSKGLTRTTCFVLNSKDKEYREFLLMLLFEDSTVKHATSISVGTTMPYTRWKEFKSMEVVLPTRDVAASFGKNISCTKTLLKHYSSQIRLLTEARDRLLPKFMSGEIKA